MTSNESSPSTDNQLEGKQKPTYWRSLSEFRGEADFNDYLDREFPVAASEFPEGVSRRRWMQLMGASLAVVGAAGCRYPEETIQPFVIRPEGRVPGEAYTRATNFELAGRVYNLLISCVDGRPLKIEPNTEHPSGFGTDAFSQASILGLFDPDRARGDEGFLRRKREKRRLELGWDDFDADVASLLTRIDEEDKSFAVLMSPTSSPTLVRMLEALKKRLPDTTLYQYDGVDGDAMQQATSSVLGKSAKQVLSLEDADVIVAIQSDILGNNKGMLKNAAGFAKRRDPNHHMNRLYVVEGGYTQTGAAADSRLALRPSQMPAFIAELGRRVETLKGGETHDHSSTERPFDLVDADERLERFLDVLSHDIAEAGDKAVVVVGDGLGAEALSAGIQMNKKLGSLGKIQKFMPTVDGELEVASLKDFVDQANAGEIDALLILGDNPVVTAPGNLDVSAAIGKVKDTTIYLGEYDDETAFVCDWSLPLAHPLESWGDCINDQGFYGVCQPQILPLLGGRTAPEMIARMIGESVSEGSQLVRLTADDVAGESLSDRQWRQLLHDGYSDGIVVDGGELTASDSSEELTADAPKAETAITRDTMEVVFAPADGIYDGRFANNGWLQEMPQSLTKLTWDNAAVMSPATAKALELKHGLFVVLRIGDASVPLPIYEMPGCAPGVVTATFGYGRTRAGMVGGHTDEDVPVIGTDVSPIRNDDAMTVAYDVQARPLLNEYELATTQDHWAIDEGGREETESRSFSLIREGTVQLLEKNGHFAEDKGPHVPHVGANGSPWQEPINRIEEENKAAGRHTSQWGMAIDLSKCTGCNACVVACQSENNVPIVGREQVLNSREMHWLRVDRYFQGDEENADIVQQPMMCQHCETAPCEQVCPVAATVHTNEGINAMAYNRCIGTRYCANNCPFKVRRFNYFNYNTDVGVGYGIDAYPSNIESANRKLQALVMNPQVTVRGRGVMEKCTYCIQRVEEAKISSRREGLDHVPDGAVVTACQSACPTKAIEFGNIADPDSAVSKKRAAGPTYGMLGQINVKPRTEYLARIRNPHERLMTSTQIADLTNYGESHHGGHDEHGGDHHDDHAGDDHAHDEHADEHGEDAHSENEHSNEEASASHD